MSISGIVDNKAVLTENAKSRFNDKVGSGDFPSKRSSAIKNNLSDSVNLSGSLSQGDSGQNISDLQKVLKDKNYYNGTVNGYYGSDTKEAVIKFQKSAGLEATGVADMETKAQLASSVSYLARGCTGEDVKELQEDLITLGYSCGPSGADGSFGPDTEIAVKNFQKAHGLEQDGSVGPATRKAIRDDMKRWEINHNDNSGTTPSTPSVEITLDLVQGCTGDQVKELQRELISLGYSCGSSGVDGSFGSDTKNAVMNFQRDHKLAQDGSVGPETRAAINRALKNREINKSEGEHSSYNYPQDLSEFMDNFKRLKALADQYCNENHGIHDVADLLTLAYIRKCNPSYSTTEWTFTAGDYPTDFPQYLENHDSEMVNYFKRNKEIMVTDTDCNKMEMSHFVASLDGLLYGAPIQKEWCAWAGDLATALVNLHSQKYKDSYTLDDYNDLKEYAKNRLIGVKKDEVPNSTSFDILDLLGDVDAINISNIYNKGGKSIDSIMNEYYGGDGVKNRFKIFLNYYGGVDGLRQKANDTYCTLKGELIPNKIVKAAIIDAFVEKIAEFAGENCSLSCPLEASKNPNPRVVVNNNDENNNGHRDKTCPIEIPKSDM